MHQLFTKFYYQGKLWEKEQQTHEIHIEGTSQEVLDQENESKRIRGKRSSVYERRKKARNLRKLMVKKEKDRIEQLRKFFYRFHTNGMLFTLRKESKRTGGGRSSLNILGDIEKKEDEKEEEKPKELTFMDKKLLEKQKEKEELQKKRIEALQTIFYKTDRQYMLIKRRIVETWNLRAKIMSLPQVGAPLKKSVRKKKLKKSHRKKESNKNMLDKMESTESKESKESNKNVLEKLESSESKESK